jgi:hypothetical protein
MAKKFRRFPEEVIYCKLTAVSSAVSLKDYSMIIEGCIRLIAAVRLKMPFTFVKDYLSACAIATTWGRRDSCVPRKDISSVLPNS